MEKKQTCGEHCEVYSRVCGYFRPISNWNKGKKEEFKERKTFEVKGMTLLLFAAMCMGLLVGCAGLENKSVAAAGAVDAIKIESAGGAATGTALPNLTIGGATSALATSPVVEKDKQVAPVYAYSRRSNFFGQLFGLDCDTESMVYIGLPNESADVTTQRLQALKSMSNSQAPTPNTSR